MLGYVFIATQKKSNPTYASALLFNGTFLNLMVVMLCVHVVFAGLKC